MDPSVCVYVGEASQSTHAFFKYFFKKNSLKSRLRIRSKLARGGGARGGRLTFAKIKINIVEFILGCLH